MSRFYSSRAQLAVAWALLLGSLLGWPLSALTWARDEPQFILGLSWVALIVSAYTTLVAAHGNRLVEGAK